MQEYASAVPYRPNREPMAPEGLYSPEPRAFGAPRPAPSGPPSLTDWLQVDPCPVLLVNAAGQLLEANESGAALISGGSAAAVRGRTLAFTDTQAQQAFLRALALVISRRSLAKSIVLRGNDGAWRQVELRACAAGGDSVFVRFAAEPQGAVDIDPLVQAFALSPSEGEVLRRLTEGLAPKEIARALSISTNTVRAHLRMLYLKMNVRGISGVIRQSVRLTR